MKIKCTRFLNVPNIKRLINITLLRVIVQIRNLIILVLHGWRMLKMQVQKYGP